MLKLIGFILIGLLSFGCFAQVGITTYQEAFSNNTKSWSQMKSDTLKMSVSEGKYKLKCINQSNGFATFNDIDFQWNKNYEVNCRMRFVAGDTNLAYGIMWGANQARNYELIKFYSAGYIQYSRMADKNYYESYREPTGLKLKDNWLNVKIVRLNDDLTLYCNDSLLIKEKTKFTKGTSIGFYMEGTMEVEVDDINIAYFGKEIKVFEPMKGLKPVPLSRSINSKKMELSPVISRDGDKLYFLRQNDENNIGVKKLDDIWISFKENGKWSEAKNIGRPLNNEGINFVVSSCKNGKVLYLANTYYADGSQGEPGISRSELINNKWTLPVLVEIDDYYSNTPYTSYFINDDETVMLLGLERDEGLGSRDIYVSFIQQNGMWSKPKSLGDKINTAGKELAPFLATDSKTLIFASDGHPGYGLSDLFITKRLDDTWENWSEPLNLGLGINSTSWDAYLTIPMESNEIFMVREDSANLTDIYSVTIDDKSIIDPTLLIDGFVIDFTNNDTIDAVVNIVSKDQNDRKNQLKTLNGSYECKMNYTDTYFISAEVEGYYSQTDTVSISEAMGFRKLSHDLLLKPIKENETYLLKNIYFEQDKYDVLSTSQYEISKLVHFLNINSNAKIRLEGHTEKGSSKYLMELSRNRVEALRNVLIDQGINKKRIKVKSFGGSMPLYFQKEEIHLNRRVEFRIIKLEVYYEIYCCIYIDVYFNCWLQSVIHM